MGIYELVTAKKVIKWFRSVTNLSLIGNLNLMQLSAFAFIRILNSKAVLLLMALALLQLLWLIRFYSAFCILC
jgi:hypothetical protein